MLSHIMLKIDDIKSAEFLHDKVRELVINSDNTINRYYNWGMNNAELNLLEYYIKNDRDFGCIST